MTSLNTELTRDGIKLTDTTGAHQGMIGYINSQDKPWHVVATGADPGLSWSTREAAEFYALAVYAERTEMNNRTAERDFHNNN